MAERDLTAVLRLLEQLGPALERQDYAGLRAIIQQLVALRAPMGGQWQQLAQIAADIGEIDLARKAIDLHVDAAGRTHAALYQKTALLAHAGLWAEADALLRTIPATVPDPVANAYSRGIGALNLGRSDEARRYLEQVTATCPQSGSAWLGLAMVTDLAGDPALAARMMAADHAMRDAPPNERAAYEYAVGTLHAAHGEHAAAFAAFARGARAMRRVVRFDEAEDRREAADAVRGFDAGRIAALARHQRAPTRRTIFATGLPRSGTTLVQQALTAHSAVGDGAELGTLPVLASEVGGTSCEALVRHIEARGAEPAAGLWHRWLAERFPGSRRVVDKSIDTSRYLGIAAVLLPEAPLLWITRDPLDRAWSCFRTNFMGGAIPWSYDLRDIAAHFRVEDELLARWQDILGDRLLVVPYEGLVTEPEVWLRAILAHCGLAEEPQVFAPHENARPVPTASMVQVRRPINRDAVGSAGPYREFLAPFVEAYYG
jgi:hypothetical protein